VGGAFCPGVKGSTILGEKRENRTTGKGTTVKKTLLIQGLLVACVALLVVGCQTGGKVTPEDAIKAQVAKMKAAMATQKVPEIMTVFSENFKSDEWGDKAGMKDFIQQSVDMGYLEKMEVVTANMQIKVNGNTAVAYPIELNGSFGSITIELTFTKEAAGWMVTKMTTSGM
jgi:hypothetical protein